GGGNAVNRMISAALKGVEFIAVNTDMQALDACNADVKVNIGHKVTRRLGTGADWTKARDSADDTRAEPTELRKDSDMVAIAADVLRQGVQGIADLIVSPGTINLDFADVKAVMQDTGEALMGIGFGSGDNRAEDAAKQAVSSPLLETSIDGAQGILFNITAGRDITLHECEKAAELVN